MHIYELSIAVLVAGAGKDAEDARGHGSADAMEGAAEMPYVDPSLHQSWESIPESDVDKIVVVGGGPAAHRCVAEVRKLGFSGSLTMVSAETTPPYDRTLLSKDSLRRGGAPGAAAGLRATYDDLDVQLLLGREASNLEPVTRNLGISDGTELDYDRLILAVGGTPLRPRALDAPGVLTMRNVDDVEPIRDALERSRHLVVIGAGFIGGEIAAVATEYGCGVTLLEAFDAPLEPVLGPTVGGLIGRLHKSNGVDVRCGSRVHDVVEKNGGYQVSLDDGTQLNCDNVVIGVGMRPQLDWLRSVGMEMDRAILVDAECRTSIPNVLAAGDCAQWWSTRYGRYCHIEHWDIAGKHGAAAGRAALGRPANFNPLPFFWSDQYDVKYQWAGHAPQWDSVEIDGDDPSDFTARYVIAGELVAVLTANRPIEFGRLRRELISSPELSQNDTDKERAAV